MSQQGNEPSNPARGSAPPAGTAAHRPIAIPSFREVRQAERPAAAPQLFRPSGAPPTAPVTAISVNPLAFIDGGARAPGGPPPAGAHSSHESNRAPGGAQPGTAMPQHQHYPASRYPQPGSSGMPPQQYSAGTDSRHPHGHHPGPGSNGRGASGSIPSAVPRPSYGGAAPPSLQQQGSGGAMGPPPPVTAPFNPNAIMVSRRQQGNPVLKHIRNVRWQYGDIIPDYVLGQSTAALFLSLRYHLLKPEYIYSRMKELGRAYRLRVLLVYVDTEDAVEPLAQVTRAAIGNDFTLLCGFTVQECARYLETLKSFERKPAETIQKDLGTDYVSRANSALTTIRGVNKTDVKTLGDAFGSMAAIFQASAQELQACPGIGPTKARRLHETFHEPFRRTLTATAAQAPSSTQAVAAMPTTTEAALVGHSPVAEGDATHGTVAAQHGGEGGARQAHAVMEDDNAADEDAEDDLDFS